MAGTLYTDKEIVFDGSTTGMENPVFTDTTVLTLSNSKVTIKNYAKVALPAGFLLQNGSTLTITPLSGIDRPFSLDVNGDAKFTTASKFIFDGSKLSYSSSVQALNLFHFSFDLGAGGLILLQDDTFSVTLPTYGSYTLGSKRPSIKIGSTITDTLKYSPVVIYGTFSIDQIDRTHLYQVDFGPDKPVVAPGNAPALSVINTKIYGITCLYANIFQNTIGGSLSTSGLHAYVPQNAFTLNLLYQPTFTNPNEEPYDILFTADQTALITIKNMIQYPSDIYQLQGPFPAIRVLSNGAGVLSSSFSDPNQLLNLAIGSANVRFRLPKPERKFDLLAIGSNKDLSPNYAIPNYSNVLTIALIGDLVIRPPYTTTHTDPKTTEILLISDYSSSDAVNHQWVIGHSTVTLYNQPQGDTKIIDLGNGVTEYQVLSYEPSQILNPANPLKPYATVTRTVLYSPPPVTTISIDQNHEHIEEIVSYFITTDSNGKIITDSKVIPITTKYDPAPDPETNTIDLGNEITEYVVISYWTTLNEDGKIITTSKVQTYSPPPVTVTATTAADYVESDWISFFITTNEKGEIITDSTLFNATRDYNLPEAPHTSFGPAPPAETKTVDLGNEVTEYLVISYWTTTNEFGGLITTSSTRTYSPPPVTVTATTAADYVESDWISFFITTNEKGEIITDSTLFNATREFIDAEELYVSSSSISSLLLSSSVLLTSDVVVPTSNSGTSTSSISSFISNSVVLSSSISSSSVIFSSVDKPSMLSSSESGSDLLSSSSTIESAGIIGSSVIVSVSTSSFNSDIVTALGSSTYSLVHSLSSDLGSVNSFNSSTLMTEGELPGSTSHHTSVYPTSESEVIEVSENSTIDIDTYDPYSTSTEHQDINEEIPSNSIQSTYTDSTSTTQITSSYYGINSEMDTNASHILSHYYSTSKDGIVITSVVTISTVSPGHSPVSNIADKSDSSRVNTVITPPNSVINNFATNNAEQSLSIENHNSLPKSNDNLSEVLYGTATTLTKSIYHTYDTLQGNSVVSVLTSTSTLPNVSSKSTLPTSSIQRTSQSVSEGTASIETLYKASGSHHKKSATLLESILLIFIILLV